MMKTGLIGAFLLICKTTTAAAQDRPDMADMLDVWFPDQRRDELLAKFETWFGRLDVDGTPGLSEADWEAFSAARLEAALRKAATSFDSDDLDGDGRMTPDEISTVAHAAYGFAPGDAEATGHLGVARLIDLRERSDTNGDGVVTREEVLAEREASIREGFDDTRLIFDGLTAGLDTDSDGVVTLDEIVSGFDRLAPLIDTNGDGRIDPRERRAFLASR